MNALIRDEKGEMAMRRIGVIIVWCTVFGCGEHVVMQPSEDRVLDGDMRDAQMQEVDASLAEDDASMRESVECNASFTDVVTLSGEPRDSFIVLPVGEGSQAQLFASAWQIEGSSLESKRVYFEWDIQGDSDAIRRSHPYDGGRRAWATFTAHADLFDRPDVREPGVVVRACVRNGCPRHDGGACMRCRDRVCSDAVMITTVPSLSGEWELFEDNHSMGVHIFTQSGRHVHSDSIIANLYIWLDEVSGDDIEFTWNGRITVDRQTISGEIHGGPSHQTVSWEAHRTDE